MLPHERLLPLEGLSSQKEIVRVFYKDMWDHADKALIPRVFHHDFTFPAGHSDRCFAVMSSSLAMLIWSPKRSVSTQQISSTLSRKATRSSQRCGFTGSIGKELLGVAPTGTHVWWYGVPMFTFEDGKVRDLWVLGDLQGLLRRLQ